MTSNLGSQLIRERFEHITEANRNEVVDQTKLDVLEMLKQTIRPEFLNRIDEIIMFTPLNREQIKQIVRLQIEHVQRMLRQSSGIELTATEAAVERLADEGFDPEFGARPVKRAIHRMVLNRLSRDIIAGTVTSDHPIVVDTAADGSITFHN